MVEDEEEDCKVEKVYKSVDDVMATVKHVWDSLPSETISSMYESMPDRLNEVIKMKGHRTFFLLFIDTTFIILYYQFLVLITLKNIETLQKTLNFVAL